MQISYYTNENIAMGFMLCNSTASATTCCGIGEACLTSGLCYGAGDGLINAGAWTDETWKDVERREFFSGLW